MRKKNFKGVLLLSAVMVTMTFNSVSVLATTNQSISSQEGIVVQDISEDDYLLTRKESVMKFMEDHPEYKNDVLEILNNKGALNNDGSIKEDLGISKSDAKNSTSSTIQAVDPLFIGYDYTLMGYGPALVTYPKEYVGAFSNYSSSPQPYSVNQSVSHSTTIEASVSIGSKTTLGKVHESSAGVSLSYSYTAVASQEYGSTMTVPARTRFTLYSSPLKTCYSYKQQYYILGVPFGNYELIGVFKPTASHWSLTEQGL